MIDKINISRYNFRDDRKEKPSQRKVGSLKTYIVEESIPKEKK